MHEFNSVTEMTSRSPQSSPLARLVQVVLAALAGWLLGSVASAPMPQPQSATQSAPRPDMMLLRHSSAALALSSSDVVSGSWTGLPWATDKATGVQLFAKQAGMERARNEPLLVIYGGNPTLETAVLSEEAHLVRLLRHAYGWKLYLPKAGLGWDANGQPADMVQTFGRMPDLLLFIEQHKVVQEAKKAGGMPNVPMWLTTDDAHWHAASIEESKRRQEERGSATATADLILATYPWGISRFYKDWIDPAKVVWRPHSATLECVLPLNKEPMPVVLLAGATYPGWYPTRHAILQKIKGGDGRLMYHKHPGYYQDGFYVHSPRFRSVPQTSMATALNEVLACITDGLFLNNTISKMFEIPATGCLMMVEAGMVEALSWLGFEPGVHYVPYTLQSLDAVVDAVLDTANRAAVDQIRANGQSLVLARHLVTHRAASLHEAAVRAAIPGQPFPMPRAYDSLDLVTKVVGLDG